MRALNWIGFATVGLVAFFLGMLSAQQIGFADLDAELSGLLGGALGAAITVFGAMWLAQYQANRETRAFSSLIGDSITAIRNEAYLLVCLSEADIATEHAATGEKCREQVRNIREAFSLFESNMTLGAIVTYETRLWIFRLERTIQENLRVFEKEGAWLNGTLTKAVVRNAQADLGAAAQLIFEGCVGAHRELKHKAPLPTDGELKRRGILLPSSE